jgi:hypothetical protein
MVHYAHIAAANAANSIAMLTVVFEQVRTLVAHSSIPPCLTSTGLFIR